MANTNYLTFFILVLVFFNFFAGSFSLSKESEDFNITKYLAVSNLRTKLEVNKNLFTSILNVVLIPFLLIDGIIFLFVIIGVGVSILPPIVNLLIFIPIGIIITYDYIIPSIRGN